MLDKLGFEKKVHVGISVSINNTIELVYIDSKSKSVSRYASGNVKYNSAIREIIDYNEFTEVVENLFEDAGLTPSECAVTLTMPNVCFGITPMESSTEQSYIIDNLQTELEDLYIFKRNEPVISYSRIGGAKNGNNIIYSAMQSKVVGQMMTTFDNLGVEIERIDTAYSSVLRALKYCDRVPAFNQPEEHSILLIITVNSCSAFSMNGGLITNFKEQPLAVKSFTPEEVFTTLSTFIENITAEENPQSVFIISETAEVSPDLLVERLDFKGDIDYIGVNTNEEDQLISTELAASDNDSAALSTISLDAIGAAVSAYTESEVDLNFLPSDRIKKNQIHVGEYEIDFTRYILVLLMGAIIIGAILGFGIKTFLAMQVENQEIENSANAQKIQAFEERLKSGNPLGDQTKVFPTMQKIMDSNKNIVNTYIGLSTEIPDSIYIKKFVTNANGGIGILGESTTSEDVEKFVSRLKEKNNDLMVSRLAVNTKNDAVPAKIPNGFTFEIKTTTGDIDFNDDAQEAVENSIDTIKNNVKNSVNSIQQSSGNPLTPPPAPII